MERDRANGDDGGAPSDDSDNDETSVSSVGSTSFHELDFRLSSVVKRLDALYKLAARIRNPRYCPQRPTKDLYEHISEGQREEYRENQRQVETTIVTFVQQRQLETHINNEGLQTSEKGILEQYASSTHWLVRRIGLANARRKQQFLYWGNHTEPIARNISKDITMVLGDDTPAAIPTMGPTENQDMAISEANVVGEYHSRALGEHETTKSRFFHYGRRYWYSDNDRHHRCSTTF